MKSFLVLGASFAAAAAQEDVYQSWTSVVESLQKEDECNSQDSACSVSLLQMRSNAIKKEVVGDDSLWNFETDMEPQNWASLHDSCGGVRQSPIDLPAADDLANQGDPLEVSYTAVAADNLQIKNNGRGMQVKAAFGELVLPDGVYAAKRVHVHCPSEHTIEGATMPCELYIIHQRRSAEGTDGLAIIAIMLEQAKLLGLNGDSGRELAFFRRLGLGNRLGLPGVGEKVPIANIPIDLGVTFRRQLQGGYYHYQGSLPYPPCSETVHWYVMKQPAAISEEMLENFMIIFGREGHNRPVQALNGRPVVMDEESAVASEFAGAVNPHWTYGEQDKWSENFPACASTAQSPIDLNGVPVTTTGASLVMHAKYHESVGAGLEIKNNGHTLQVNANNDIGYLKLYDGNYYVQQIHFHFPAEHSVDGQLAAGEMQIYHQKEGSTGTDDLAVVSILIDDVSAVGDVDFDQAEQIAFFRRLGFHNELPHVGHKVPVAVDDTEIVTSFATQLAGPFWHYRGSLTAPPCTEGVHWYVMQKHAVMSHNMVVAFNKLFPNPANNRVVQPRGPRRVEMTMALPDEFER
jgi:carbonic anhydrase